MIHCAAMAKFSGETFSRWWFHFFYMFIHTWGNDPIYNVLQMGRNHQLSHEKNPPTFHYTGWLIGILTMVY